MASSNTHAFRASNAGLAVRRLLRRSRIALFLSWFALWLGAIGYTYCAVPIPPAGASRNAEQSSASDDARAPQNSQWHRDNQDCRQLVDASTVFPPVASVPVSGDETSNPTLPHDFPSLALRTDGGFPAHYSYLPHPGLPLYLHSHRLLI